ncbi:MAG: hypothetical protein R3C11_10965 [Planctomycetaceae bacterium]
MEADEHAILSQQDEEPEVEMALSALSGLDLTAEVESGANFTQELFNDGLSGDDYSDMSGGWFEV